MTRPGSQRKSPEEIMASFVESIREDDLVFLDCGANDGCSTIKYLQENPLSKVLAFEPNPRLSWFHWLIPNTLIRCAVAASSSQVLLMIDPIDADGSTIVPTKPVDATKQLLNEGCPSLVVRCISLVPIIESLAKKQARIDLKLDIEGAEYDVIDQLVKTGAAKYLSRFYCEFHWDRIGMDETTHRKAVHSLSEILRAPIVEWDAQDWMSVNLQGTQKLKMLTKRTKIVALVYLWRLLQRAKALFAFAYF